LYFTSSYISFLPDFQELNKCKTEIQYWRSKTVSHGQNEASSPPVGAAALHKLCANCTEAKNGRGAQADDKDDHPPDVFPSNKQAAVEAAPVEEPPQPPAIISRPATRGSMSGPPSPAIPPPQCGATRKRRANTVTMEEEVTRKSLRGTGTRSGAKKALQNASKVL
jgi:hypothetical protein